MTIGIVGLGLIGGSLAKAYKSEAGNTVFGWDIDTSMLEFAILSGAVDGVLDSDSIKNCDGVLLAVTPRAAVEYLESIAPHISKDTIVMDCCGVKRYVCERCFEIAREHGFTFVGAHPMAGTHNSGFKYSSAELFRGAPMVLVPPVFDDMELLSRCEALLEPMGFGEYAVTTAQKHDEIIAFSSQMAHVVSNAFVKSPTAKNHKGFSAGSYKDLTRVARLNADMWSELFMENKDVLIKEIDILLNSLTQYRDAMIQDDFELLHRLLREGSEKKQEVDTVKVEASKSYEVIIGSGILEKAGEYAKKATKVQSAVIITDDIVDALYAEKLQKSLEGSGFRVEKYVLAHGETSKNAENYISILEFLAEKHLTRTDTIIALGGGVVGDIAGFTASSYLRGIGFIQIPTTLLAAVDSSVGGKTAIDLKAGKNLAGAFCQPSLVLCDYNCLETLTPEAYRDGCAEIIKTGIIADRGLFDKLNEPISSNYEEIITRCVEIKRDVVREDERESGMRKLLNFGHTVGHAIEKLSNYAVSHGQAVAAGMAIITRASAKKGICSDTCRDEIIAMLKRYSLSTTTEYSPEELYHACLNDKKMSGGTITLIVPERIGLCKPMNIPVEELERFISLGIEE